MRRSLFVAASECRRCLHLIASSLFSLAMILGCMALVAGGCHMHFWGRYYPGAEREKVLMETPTDVDEDPFADWRRNGSARPMPWLNRDKGNMPTDKGDSE